MESRVEQGLSAIPVVLDGLLVKEPLGLAAFVETIKKLEGRDKLTKIVQYGARFFVWWYRSIDPKHPKGDKAYKLYRTTQLSRKAFRLLKVLEEVDKLRAALPKGAPPAYCNGLLAIRSVAMGCFWTFDNLNYLTTTSTVNFGNERALRGFSRSWTAASAITILVGVHDLRKTQRKRVALLAKEHAAEAEVAAEGARRQGLRERLRQANAEHFKAWLMVLKGFLDLTCATNMVGVGIPKLLLGHKLNDGVIGAAGCLSALTVLYNSWPARATAALSKAPPPQLPPPPLEQQQQQQQVQGLLPGPVRGLGLGVVPVGELPERGVAAAAASDLPPAAGTAPPTGVPPGGA